jgi:hypothetical protein
MGRRLNGRKKRRETRNAGKLREREKEELGEEEDQG